MKLRMVYTGGPPSERLLRACAAFGLAVRCCPVRAEAADPSRAAQAREILGRLGGGQVALVTGPSGGGKSSLLRAMALAASARDQVLALPEAPNLEAAIIDLMPGPLPQALRTLARAGLADALLLGRTPRQLSEGERFRLRLALAMSRCEESARTTLLIDEFASTLDRTTARCLCRVLRRWLRLVGAAGQSPRLVVASAHHDIAAWLEPDLLAFVPLGEAPVEVSVRQGGAEPARLPVGRRLAV